MHGKRGGSAQVARVLQRSADGLQRVRGGCYVGRLNPEGIPSRSEGLPGTRHRGIRSHPSIQPRRVTCLVFAGIPGVGAAAQPPGFGTLLRWGKSHMIFGR